VYLAQDIKHDRKVALKVLRPELAAVIGAERFLNEIKVTANLQHPHILPLHDSGEAGGFLYYVMPFVEGDTLRDKLKRERQLDIDEAVELTRSVAAALDYAHRQGVIHRDIKPENVLLHDGQAMIADFGIALAVSHASGTRLTETGLSIGTPHYMSTEQAMGDRELDARSDIYSLGAMLYEMLSGDPPYTGSSAQAIVAKVITEKAPPVTVARDTVPPHIAAATAKALAKMPADRFRSAADFAAALQNVAFTSGPSAHQAAAGPSARPPVRPSTLTAVLATIAILATAVSVWGWVKPAPPLSVVRLDLSLASAGTGRLEGEDVVISPDGTMLAVAAEDGSGSGIFVRRLSDADFRFVPGTENGRLPEFSPDGEWLVFRDNQEGTLVRAAVSGGGALTLVDQEGVQPFHSHWGEDGTIVFTTPTGVYYLPPGGGDPVAVHTRVGGRLPFALPDGSGYLVGNGPNGIHVVDFARDTSVQVLPEGRHPTYVAPGFLLYVAESGDLFAAPFDLGRRAVTGPSLRVLDRVRFAVNRAGYSVSRTGTLVHNEGDALSGTQQTLSMIVGPRGRVDTLRLPPENRRVTRFSPDGRRIVYEQAMDGGRHDLFTFDLITGSSQQLTFEGDNDDPVWSPDGSRILFTSSRPGSDGDDLMIKPADNSAPEAYVLTRPGNQVAVAWLRDDQVVFQSNESGNRDLYTYALTDSGPPRPYLEAPWNEFGLALSPDGSLAAVETAEVPPSEIWLRDFPEPIGKWRVSFGGGGDPRWSPDGRTLYYSWGTGIVDSIFAVTVDRTAGVVVRDRRLVWAGDVVRWDLAPDGERVLVVLPQGGVEDGDVPADRYLVVVNWFEELKQRMGK